MSPVKEFTARHRFAHITARKARYVADLIRGRSVNEALEVLQFTPNRGATFYNKVLRSAIANASQDEDVNINRLIISQCKADDGPLLQGRMRFRPGPQGRAMPYAKRLSHLTVKVTEVPDDGAPKRRSVEAQDDAPGEADAPAKGGKKAKDSGTKTPAAKKSKAKASPKTAKPAKKKESPKGSAKGPEGKKA
jgi:large subunit ribosomal protein L22